MAGQVATDKPNGIVFAEAGVYQVLSMGLVWLPDLYGRYTNNNINVDQAQPSLIAFPGTHNNIASGAQQNG